MRKKIMSASLAGILVLVPAAAIASPKGDFAPESSKPTKTAFCEAKAKQTDPTCTALQPVARKAGEGQLDFPRWLWSRLAGNGTALDGVDPGALDNATRRASSAK